MLKTTKNKIKLGIFVSTSIALFIICIYFLGKRQQLFSSTFQISGVFTDISGLQVGNNVRFCGINVGIIKEIELITDTTVRVDMVVNEYTRKFMKKNTKAMIGNDGLMGNKIVVLISGGPGTSQIANNNVLATAQPVSVDEILENLKVTSKNAANITENLASIVQQIHEGKGMIGKLFMDSAFAENADDALTNIKQGAGGFKQNMDAASHNILLRPFLRKKHH